MKNLNKPAALAAALIITAAYQPASAGMMGTLPTAQTEANETLDRYIRRIAPVVSDNPVVWPDVGKLWFVQQDDDHLDDNDDDDEVDDVDDDPPPRRNRRGGSWARHVARCYDAYRSYNENTDTYTSYSGEVRRCRK